MTEPIFCESPNQFARPAGIDFNEGSVFVHGYQEFLLTKDSIDPSTEDSSLIRKHELLRPFFEPSYLAHRTVLDLGANGGFFSFLAIQNGADKAVAVDMDYEYTQLLDRAKTHLEFDNVQVERSNISHWNESADVVVALAIVHWIYSCTAMFRSLDAVIERFAQLARYMLIVEWVDETDPAIEFLKHNEWNSQFITAAYTVSAFEDALTRHFARYSVIGSVSHTRRIYAAFKTRFDIDLAVPFPLIKPKDLIISSRLLAILNGLPYWSLVYDAGDLIYKQASFDLAEHEAYFLKQFDSDYFPKLIDSAVGEGFSWLALEKIDGLQLDDALESINSSPKRFRDFALHCLHLLTELSRKGIMHRDIRPDNVMVREGLPVLLDFGWAVSNDRAVWTPEQLGVDYRPPDRSFSDVYSMGKVLTHINGGRYRQFQTVIDLMAVEDASLRIYDLEILRVLFLSVDLEESEGESGTNVH